MNEVDNPLEASVENDVLWLRINRPARRNALSRTTLSELRLASQAHASNPALKAAVIMGKGIEAFAAGGDLKELVELRSTDGAAEFFDFASTCLDAIRHFPLPVVAALNGWALGGGAELALACDFRVAAPHASIGYIHSSLAISCGFGGGADLSHLLGASAAMRHGLTGEPLPASSALTAGLVDEIADANEPLERCVLRFLTPMLKRRPQVARAYKAIAIAQRMGMAPAERRNIERDWFVRTWTHEDHWSALEAASLARAASNP